MKDEIARLIAPFLACEEFYARFEAVKALGVLASMPSSAPLLKVATDIDEDIDMRMDAIEGVAKIGDPKSHIALISLMEDKSAELRLSAIRAIGSMEVKSATEEIIAQLEGGGREIISDDEFDWDPQWDIELEAVKALGKIGDEKAVSPLIRLYEEEMSYDLAEYIFKGLCQIGSGEAIRFLSEKLKNGAVQERRLIVEAIARNKDVLKDMKSELEEALGDPEPLVRCAAVEALAVTNEQEAFKTLDDCLIDPDANVRASALSALAKIDAGEIVEKIVTALGDPSPIVRAQSAIAAQKCSAAMVQDKLLRLMNDPVDEVALRAAHSFVSFNAKGTADLLSQIALDHNRSPYIRIECLSLMALYHPDSVGELLPSPLDVEPRQVSMRVASSLFGCGNEEEIEYLINDLRELLGMDAEAKDLADEKGASRFEEEEISVKIGKKTRMVVRSPGATPGTLKAEDMIRVLSGLNHPNIRAILAECSALKQSTIAVAAVRAIGDMRAVDCIPALIAALDHASPHVRSEAAQALGQFNDLGDEVRVKLGELATLDRERMVRGKAISALGLIQADDTQEYLQKGLNDPEPDVRQAAVVALGNFGDDMAIAPLIASLFNYADFTHLREDIYNTLKKLDPATVKAGLENILKNEERALDHWVAIQALGNIFA